MELIFATNNQNKIKEVKSLLFEGLNIITLADAGIDIEIPEPHQTLEENASEKSSVIYKLTGKDCFSEDTGLEVNALNGEPGVRSASYAGEDANAEKNITLLLKNLEGKEDRSAIFRTVISLMISGNETRFTGICNGRIISERRGNSGFGYDPVFIPDGSDRTFAEMTMEEKNKYSHRKKAFALLHDHLKSQ